MQQNEAKPFTVLQISVAALMSEAHGQERLEALYMQATHCLHLHCHDQINSLIVRRAAGNVACEGNAADRRTAAACRCENSGTNGAKLRLG